MFDFCKNVIFTSVEITIIEIEWNKINFLGCYRKYVYNLNPIYVYV